MIKILYTIPNFDTAGSGRALLNIASGLDKNIFEPHILCKHNKGAFFEAVKNSQIPIHIFEYETPLRPLLKLLIGSWKVSRLIKKINPDVIYSYHYSSDYSEALAAKFAGIPWIYVKKNMSWYGPSINSWKIRSFLATKINVQNTTMEAGFLTSFKRKLFNIQIGVDTKMFKPKKGVASTKTKFIFIHVSSLLPVKGVDILLEAFTKLLSSVNACKIELWIVGPDKSEYIGKLKKKYRNSEIIFKGELSKVYEVLVEADCFIQCSHLEAAPIALQEAMASGLICIGSRVSGIKDQLAGFDEFLYDSKKADDLYRIMKNVISMPVNEKIKVTTRLVDRIKENYSLKNEIEKTEKLIIEIVKK